MQAGRRLRLGILALIAGTAFFGLLAFVLQGVLRDDKVNYFILFDENIKGMVIGSKVNFQGVPFGMVSDIRFQTGRTLVELSVDPSRAEIQDITRARLDRLLVTGQVTVELEGYGPEGQRLLPGQFIQPKSDPINQLTKTLPELVPQAQRIMDQLEVVLASSTELLGEDNRAHLATILRNGAAASASLPATMRRVDQLIGRAETALTAFERAADRINADVVPASLAALTDARAALDGMRALQESLLALSQEAEVALAGLRSPLQSALAAARTSLDELRGLARQLRLAPDSLLFGVTRPAGPVGGGR